MHLIFELLSEIRKLHLSPFRSLVSKEFEDAKARLATLKDDPGNDVKLKIYALFKQVLTRKMHQKPFLFIEFGIFSQGDRWSLQYAQAKHG